MKAFLLVFLVVFLASCERELLTGTSTNVEPSPQDVAQNKKQTAIPQGANSMEVNSLILGEFVMVSQERGDLNGDGIEDALILAEGKNNSEVSGKGAKRRLIVALTGVDGSLQIVKTNDLIVPCKTCGGIAGDPFAFMRIENQGFVVSTSGGSRERWSNDYAFRYDPAREDWLLVEVTKQVVDKDTDREMKKTFSTADFVDVHFSKFDPSKIPEVVLP